MATVKIPGVGMLQAYRMDTSTYVASNGVLYSNSEEKLKRNNNQETINYALRKLGVR